MVTELTKKFSSNSVANANKVRTLWPSKMDMMERCPASGESDDLAVVIDRVGDEANLGSAVHDVASHIVAGDQIDLSESGLHSVSIRHGVENLLSDLVSLSAAAVAAWGDLKKYFRSPQIEQAVRVETPCKNPHTGDDVTVVLSGRHDVCEIFDASDGEQVKKWGVNLDWKTGRKTDDAAYKAQMLAYSYFMVISDPAVSQVTTILVWLRDRTYSAVTFTRQEILDWFDSFVKRSAFWDGKTYCPGEHCVWCRRFYVCPARITMISSAIKTFSGHTIPEVPMVLNADGSLVDPEKLFVAYSQAKILSQLLAQFKDQIKSEVLKRGKIVVRRDGDKEIGFYSKRRRGHSSIDAQKAWDILQSVFSDDEMAEFVDVSTTKVRKAAMNKAERGNKTKYANELIDLLDAHGAVVRADDTFAVEIGVIEEEKSGNEDE